MSIKQTFSILPEELNTKLEETYENIILNYHQQKFDLSALNGAKFAETVYRILEWHTSNPHQYTPLNHHITNFEVSCKKFDNLTQFPESIRFHIPKFLISVFFIRNKRSIGHVGGDVDSNHMDAEIVLSVSKWVLAELVRIFHTTTTVEAQEVVEGLIVKEHPSVWTAFGNERVADKSKSYEDKTLILLYTKHPKAVDEKVLQNWTEYSNSSVYKEKILRPLHKKGLIEFNEKNKLVLLSPAGIEYVQKNELLKY